MGVLQIQKLFENATKRKKEQSRELITKDSFRLKIQSRLLSFCPQIKKNLKRSKISKQRNREGKRKDSILRADDFPLIMILFPNLKKTNCINRLDSSCLKHKQRVKRMKIKNQPFSLLQNQKKRYKSPPNNLKEDLN